MFSCFANMFTVFTSVGKEVAWLLAGCFLLSVRPQTQNVLSVSVIYGADLNKIYVGNRKDSAAWS